MSTLDRTAPRDSTVLRRRRLPAIDVSWAVQIFSSADLGAFASVDALLAVALADESVVVQHSDDGATSFVIVETRSEPGIVHAARVAVLTVAPDARFEGMHSAGTALAA